MRSGAGSACPFTRFDFFLEVLLLDLPDLPGVVPFVFEWAALALLPVLLWLLLAGALCAAAAGRVKPPAAIAARIHPASDCLESKVRMIWVDASSFDYLPSAGTTPGRNTVTVRSL